MLFEIIFIWSISFAKDIYYNYIELENFRVRGNLEVVGYEK